MDRRNLLKSTVALAAVAASPAAVEAAIPAPTAVPAATPLKATPYGNYVWEWLVSNDGETYYEGFPTREEAIAYAQRCDYGLIAECQKQDYDLSIAGDRILEWLNESNMEIVGDDDGITATLDQELDLERMVQRAIEAWVVKHQIDITAWSFGDTRNETKVATPSLLGSQQGSEG